jgi:hypothetical protein
MSVLKSFRLLSDGAATRHETFKGRDYLVVPVVALVQGVIWPVNSEAPDLVLEEEFSRAPAGWDGRPVFCGHPYVDGDPVTGNSPEVLEEKQIGIIFNAALVNHKLAMEAWLDTDRCAEMGGDAKDTYDRAESGVVVEISVGTLVTAEESKGEYKGKKYESIWRDIVPVHLALLPAGDVGACSVEMGCGVRVAHRHPVHLIGAEGFTLQETPMTVPAKKTTVAERTGVRPSLHQQLSQTLRASVAGMSDSEIRDELREALQAKEPSYAWIEAVYKDEVVYSIFPSSGDIQYFARGYTLNEATREGTVADTRREVEPVLTYLTADPDEAELAAAKGARNSKKDQKTIQALHDHSVSLGADCSAVKAATAVKPPCGCGGGHAPTTAETNNKEQTDMDKKARVKALIESPHNPFTADDATYLESVPDARLDTLETTDKTAVKAAADKTEADRKAKEAADLAAAAANKELTEDEFLQRAPQSIKSAMSRLQKADAAHKDGVIKTLVGAQKEYTEAELKDMPIEALERMAKMCKAAVPEVDYALRGAAREDRAAEGAIPAPPSLATRIAANNKQPAAAAK